MRSLSAPLAALAVLPVLAASPAAAVPQMPPMGIALVIAFLVISLALHEVAHAWVALLCGDTTARDLGRISFNPSRPPGTSRPPPPRRTTRSS